MTLEEAAEVIRIRAAEYEVARSECNALGMMDVRSGMLGDYEIARAKMERAARYLEDAKQVYIRLPEYEGHPRDNEYD